MKAVLIVAFLVAAAGVADARRMPSGLVIDHATKHEEFVISPRPHELGVKAPTDFSWCKHPDGVDYCTPITNQHIPQYCGSCWAQSASSAFADRIKYQRKAAFPEIILSPQYLVWCTCNGCRGGDANVVHRYLKSTGIVDESCQAYVAKGSGNECTAINTCYNCDPGDTPCYTISNYTRYYASEYGTVHGIENIKAEISTRGPVVCYIDAEPIYDWGFTAEGKKVFTAGANDRSLNHAISVVGWGHDDAQNVDYWIIRNSWGSYWGENGFFRLQMGDNQLGMEANGCYWATPKL